MPVVCVVIALLEKLFGLLIRFYHAASDLQILRMRLLLQIMSGSRGLKKAEKVKKVKLRFNRKHE